MHTKSTCRINDNKLHTLLKGLQHMTWLHPSPPVLVLTSSNQWSHFAPLKTSQSALFPIPQSHAYHWISHVLFQSQSQFTCYQEHFQLIWVFFQWSLNCHCWSKRVGLAQWLDFKTNKQNKKKQSVSNLCRNSFCPYFVSPAVLVWVIAIVLQQRVVCHASAHLVNFCDIVHNSPVGIGQA